MSEQAAGYHERLGVPLRWWAQTTMLLATFWLALVVALPPLAAWGATAVLVAGAVTVLLVYGSPVVEVRDGELRAGRAHVPVALLGDAEPLDEAATRRVAGRDADARAYLLLRPYRKESVRVRLEDPADPTPYWLISTAHPRELCAAVTAARLGSGHGV